MQRFLQKKINRNIKNFRAKPVFGKSDADWIDVLAILPEKYNNTVRFTFRCTPVSVSLKRKESLLKQKLRDYRAKQKAKQK